MTACMNCGSEKIAERILCRDELGTGLKLLVNSKVLGMQTGKSEKVLADLCRDCGTVRFYVASTDHEWRTE